MTHARGRLGVLILSTCASLSLVGAVLAVGNVRLSNDTGGGYVSLYTLATGNAYTDNTIDECAVSRGRQNEPAVAMDPRNTQVLVGSSNDYCGVYQPPGSATPAATGPVWLGYYRSEDGGTSFASSLVPGYPGDTSPYAALAHVRTASSGDPVLAWDNHGRLFAGSEASGDPGGSKKTFGDVWVASFDNPGGETGPTSDDGKRFVGSQTVASGSSAPNLLGVFHDKTSIEADRTGGHYDGNVYFAWTRFTGGKNSNIYFVRSTDHGATFSQPMNLTPRNLNLQDPEISVTGNGDVYVTFDTFATNSGQPFGLYVTRSTDGGRTFGQPSLITTYNPVDVQDVDVNGGAARDCGDFTLACQSGYTFFRQSTSLRATADQTDAGHAYLYLVYGATRPGSEVATGNTFGVVDSGVGGQEVAYFVRYDGATGSHTTPAPLSDQATGHQVFPDISADGGVLHAIWWDSRNDPTYSTARPIGNDADGNTVPSLDVFGATSSDGGATWTGETKLTDTMSNPNYEQFSNRSLPFAGDYLWVTSIGSSAFGTWTDWRDTVAGTDQREASSEDNDGADVLQCRAVTPSGVGGDTCPRSGGLDQNIYGAVTP